MLHVLTGATAERSAQRAGESFAIGIVVTEAQIWTRPWQARRDLEEDRTYFGNVVPSAPPKAVLRVHAAGLGVTF